MLKEVSSAIELLLWQVLLLCNWSEYFNLAATSEGVSTCLEHTYVIGAQPPPPHSPHTTQLIKKASIGFHILQVCWVQIVHCGVNSNLTWARSSFSTTQYFSILDIDVLTCSDCIPVHVSGNTHTCTCAWLTSYMYISRRGRSPDPILKQHKHVKTQNKQDTRVSCIVD